jgi:hypothetical protein
LVSITIFSSAGILTPPGRRVSAGVIAEHSLPRVGHDLLGSGSITALPWISPVAGKHARRAFARVEQGVDFSASGVWPVIGRGEHESVTQVA